MGICCIGNKTFEADFDYFFYSMKVVEECTLDVYELINMNIDFKQYFYNGRVDSFIDNFFEHHIKNEKNIKRNAEVRKYFEYQFNSNVKSFFNFTSFLILLSKGNCNAYADHILKLAQRFNISTKDDKEISRKSFESMLFSYIKFVSIDTVKFVKTYSSNPGELCEKFAEYFSEDCIKALHNQLLRGCENKDFINLNDFFNENYQNLHHKEIRIALIEMKR